MKPRAVLVTGAPGSGKSTLARELSRELRVPYLARDDVRGGLLFSTGAWTETPQRIPTGDEAVELFVDLVHAMLTQGVSCVIEYVVRANRPQDLDRIRSAGGCLVVRTVCERPIERMAQRNLGDRLIARPTILDALGYESVEAHTAAAVPRMREVEQEMLTEFPVPLMEVDTTDGYGPSLDDIIDFAIGPASAT